MEEGDGGDDCGGGYESHGGRILDGFVEIPEYGCVFACYKRMQEDIR